MYSFNITFGLRLLNMLFYNFIPHNYYITLKLKFGYILLFTTFQIYILYTNTLVMSMN